ncbi:MAG: hypothetical protein KAS95_01255 [Candidatus Heimdallarchaeota archaeon]|nr:hypothetical protein [Candidatus Heimdallarchaeota archaeon]
MPSEITSQDQLDRIIKLTIEQSGDLITKRSKDKIKLKFRTKKTLFTIKLPLNEAEKLIGELSSKLNVVSL